MQNIEISVITPSIRPEGLEVVRRTLNGQSFRNFEWIPKLSVVKEIPDLCRSCNDALRVSKGKIIVFLQDYISLLSSDALRKIYDLHQKYGKTAFTYPVGKTIDWKTVDWEWRKHMSIDTVLEYHHWEIDFGSIERSAIFEVGGFDEDYDSGFGWENVDLAYRLNKLGLNFRCDSDILSVAFDHDRLTKHPFKNRPNRDLWIGKKYAIDNGDVVKSFLA